MRAAADSHDLISEPGIDELLARARRWGADLRAGVSAVFADEAGEELIARLADLIVAAWGSRPHQLRERDRERLLMPDWFQRPETLGYVCYTDRFAGTLDSVVKHVDYLSELGITYLHLMPLLRPRPAPNDGGYAVADYREVRADLGTIGDLERLADVLHANNISLTVDLVLNHVAREHQWAVAARAGDEKYRDYFYVYPDRTIPDEYEKSLPEVFPDFAPGNFTWDEELNAWVWTTFNDYQWDVNWSNPNVVYEFADIALYLANRGVDCLRLDAIAFIWKRMGTNSQNQPEVHALTRILRAVARIATPSLVFKAEAIVAPEDVVTYLGVGDYAGNVSDLAYHNSLMVQIWSALATRDVRLLSRALSRFPAKPTTTAWATYLRCHDDIGWAIDDADAASVGWTGYDHRRFLSEWFAGRTPYSFARGEEFQVNEATGDSRISGSAASLIGIEQALDLGNDGLLDDALARLRCAYAIVYGFGGIPLLYMGDELGLLNDHSYVNDPERAADNRWMHRPEMNWDVAAGRHQPGTLQARVFESIKRLGDVRRSLPCLHAAVESHAVETPNRSVLVLTRAHASGDLVQVYNVSPEWQRIPSELLGSLHGRALREELAGSPCEIVDGEIVLAPYAALWLTSKG